ncbi:MAG: N-acetyl-gamma-glutamyl-phosphate reductase [Chloroflexi bacterium]|nr:N-acetyl-gamma-glutamyl-phosphate reductase [Chloroflexota bacterium]
MTIHIGICGVTGYTGFELVRLLASHPTAEIVFATSQTFAGQTLDAVYPQAPAIPLIAEGDAPYETADVVFLCLPHAASAATAVRALQAGCKVIDLSADFRLKDVATYEAWYKVSHPAPHLLETAVYGLTEWAREEIKTADLVACPGCYPTSILLPLKPLLSAGAVAGTVIADSKSGVSGAGRTPKQASHFVEVSDNLSPYSIGQSHRHWPEISQAMGWWAQPAPSLIFSPHLIPIPRGMLSTIYMPLAQGWDEAQVREALHEAYSAEPFIKLLPAGQHATVAHAIRTNRCAIGVQMGDPHTLILTSAIDNLTKGASGQAVQNMNVMFGVREDCGLGNADCGMNADRLPS